jgi:hypothetical protein
MRHDFLRCYPRLRSGPLEDVSDRVLRHPGTWWSHSARYLPAGSRSHPTAPRFQGAEQWSIVACIGKALRPDAEPQRQHLRHLRANNLLTIAEDEREVYGTWPPALALCHAQPALWY